MLFPYKYYYYVSFFSNKTPIKPSDYAPKKYPHRRHLFNTSYYDIHALYLETTVRRFSPVTDARLYVITTFILICINHVFTVFTFSFSGCIPTTITQ